MPAGEHGLLRSESIEKAVESLVRDRLLLAGGRRYLSLGIKSGETGRLVSVPARPPSLDQYRPSLRDRWTRRAALRLARLLQEPERRRGLNPID